MAHQCASTHMLRAFVTTQHQRKQQTAISILYITSLSLIYKYAETRVTRHSLQRLVNNLKVPYCEGVISMIFFYDNKSTLGASRMLWKYQNAQSMYQRHTESIKSGIEVAVYKTAFKSLARTSVRLRCNNCAVTALNQSPEASLSTLSLSWQHSLTVS